MSRIKKWMVVLATTIFGSSLLIGATVAPVAATGASGHSISKCTSLVSESGKPNRIYYGGAQFFNGDGQTGGDRVLCVPLGSNQASNSEQDPNFSWDNRSSNDQKYQDVWGNFKNKTESLKVRAQAGCVTEVLLYKTKTKYNNNAWFGKKEVDRIWYNTPQTINFNLSEENDNTLDAVRVFVYCPWLN